MENARLRAQLREMQSHGRSLDESRQPGDGTIVFDTRSNVLRVRGLKARDIEVEALDVRVDRGGALVRDILDATAALDGCLHLPPDLVGQLQTAPLTVRHARLAIPQEAATRAILQTRSGRLEHDDIREVKITFKPGNRMEVQGIVDVMIPVSFDLRGDLALTPDARVRFDVKKLTFGGGILPVPALLGRLLMAFHDRAVADSDVSRDGNAYLMDVSDLIPKNARVQLSHLETRDGTLIVEGESPTP